MAPPGTCAAQAEGAVTLAWFTACQRMLFILSIFRASDSSTTRVFPGDRQLLPCVGEPAFQRNLEQKGSFEGSGFKIHVFFYTLKQQRERSTKRCTGRLCPAEEGAHPARGLTPGLWQNTQASSPAVPQEHTKTGRGYTMEMKLQVENAGVVHRTI